MVSVIIVDYKTTEKTCEYITHFTSMVDEDSGYHFIVVDNSETLDKSNFILNNYRIEKKLNIFDKEAYILKNGNHTICYVIANSNLGFAKGNNLGVKIANEIYNDEFYIISNNDLKFNQKLNWKEISSLFDKDTTIAVVGPQIIGLNKEKQNPYKKVSPFYWLIIYPWSRFWPFKSKGDLYVMNHSDYCYRVMGCFMIIKAEYYKKIDGFDPHTFMYGEECILSERLLQYGLKTFYYNDFSITHEHGTTVRRFSSTIQNDKWLFNSIFYYCKSYRNATILLLFFAKINRGLNVLVIYMKEIIKKIIRRFFSEEK